jgi:hypothetical protein
MRQAGELLEDVDGADVGAGREEEVCALLGIPIVVEEASVEGVEFEDAHPEMHQRDWVDVAQCSVASELEAAFGNNKLA